MQISIETVEGKNINLEVEDTSKTIDLKIHGPTRQLILRLGPDHDSNPDLNAVMRIYVVTLSGKRFSLNVHANETVKELKAKCEKVDGTLVEHMRLIFVGKALEDERTLAECNIHHESSIHLVARLCGC